MITIHLNNKTEQQFNYTISRYKNYGSFIESILKQIKWYIFSTDTIKIELDKNTVNLNDINFNDLVDINHITKIDV